MKQSVVKTDYSRFRCKAKKREARLLVGEAYVRVVDGVLSDDVENSVVFVTRVLESLSASRHVEEDAACS